MWLAPPVITESLRKNAACSGEALTESQYSTSTNEKQNGDRSTQHTTAGHMMEQSTFRELNYRPQSSTALTRQALLQQCSSSARKCTAPRHFAEVSPSFHHETQRTLAGQSLKARLFTATIIVILRHSKQVSKNAWNAISGPPASLSAIFILDFCCVSRAVLEGSGYRIFQRTLRY